MKSIVFHAIILALVFVGFAESSQESRFIAVPDEDGVQRVYMRAGSYYYKPSHIVVRAGIPVELVVIRESTIVPHNIVMDNPSAGMEFRVEIDPDEPVKVRFTPTRAGIYPFYCDKKLPFLPSHREKGMEGVIEVIE